MVADFMSTLTFLTILSVPWKAPKDRLGRIFGFFPLVGALIGGIVYFIASIQFLPRDLVAFLALLAWVSLTGGLHLDGFADACDGLLATVTPDRRLAIMK